LLFLVWLLGIGHWLEAPQSMPTEGDLIVVLGGDVGDRTLRSVQLFRATNAKVLITGLEYSPRETRSHYSSWRASILVDAGIPREAILFDRASSNSWEEAHYARDLMLSNQWKTALVVSDPPHLRRLDWTWRRAFEKTSLEYKLVASNAVWWKPGRWWAHEKSAQMVITEQIKLVYYIFTK
jgi:uncharacterized SAM-binding protein YcdF (DUF218 family)